MSYPGSAALSGIKDNPFSEEDWTEAFKLLFNKSHENQCLEVDYGVELKKLFADPDVFYQLDLEAILAGPSLFGGYAVDEVYSDDEWQCLFTLPSLYEFVAFYKIRPCKAAKKRLMFRSSTEGKCTRRHKKAFPLRRAKKIMRKIQRGGSYESRPISYGSYVPCGFEMY